MNWTVKPGLSPSHNAALILDETDTAVGVFFGPDAAKHAEIACGAAEMYRALQIADKSLGIILNRLGESR